MLLIKLGIITTPKPTPIIPPTNVAIEANNIYLNKIMLLENPNDLNVPSIIRSSSTIRFIDTRDTKIATA